MINNNQYQFPINYEASAETFLTATPEFEKKSRFGFVEDCELHLEEMRANADQTTIPRYRLKNVMSRIPHLFSVVRTHKELRPQLIDIERQIVGNALPKLDGVKTQGFWNDRPGDWYLEQDGRFARFVFKNEYDDVEKLVDGLQVPLEQGEEEAIVKTIPFAVETLEKKFYDLAA